MEGRPAVLQNTWWKNFDQNTVKLVCGDLWVTQPPPGRVKKIPASLLEASRYLATVCDTALCMAASVFDNTRCE